MAVKKKKADDFVAVAGLDDFVGNPELEEEGVWMPLEDGTGREFKIAHGSNSKFQAKLARKMRPHHGKLRKRNAEAMMLQRRITAISMSGTVLKDWRGGGLPEFSETLGEQLLPDPHYRLLLEKVEELSGMEDEFVESVRDAAVKN
jgi:hypothetical protein